MRIQHNIMAMSAYRNYNTNTSALSKNLEKLSSGYKINRAGDDAAGLAISEKMRAQITGLNAAQKNVKDGISLVKTAEGAMQEIQDMLNRMDYLATQSANGTYDNPVDRKNLQKEVDALKTEIDRIAQSANFNGITLLDGTWAGSEGTPAGTAAGAQHFDILKTGSSETHYQLHKAGASAVSPKFQIDLKQAVEGAHATTAISSTATFSLKVTVGGANLTISGLKLKSGVAAVATDDVIKAEDIDFSDSGITITGSAAGSVSIDNSDGSAVRFSVTNDNGVLKFQLAQGSTIKNIDCNMSVTIVGSGVSVGNGDNANSGGNNTDPLSYNCMTQNVQNGKKATGTQLAHGHFDLTSDMVNSLVKGGQLKIGDKTITLAADATGVKNGVIGIKDLMDEDSAGKKTFDVTDDDKMAELGRRITMAAASSSVFTVGVSTDGKTITLEEKYNNTVDLTKEDLFKKQVGYIESDTPTDAVDGTTGLFLQIGDTSDGFNRMEIKIGSMFVRDMGKGKLNEGTANEKDITMSIEDIDISKPEGAKDAIDVIKNAINYVSGVRGDLGAYQNRLEHTANNLSVMAENIQDAESTIRDTDVAEEMMAYTKNNILVQSAQAMLAQANAVPQGVLQLLG